MGFPCSWKPAETPSADPLPTLQEVISNFDKIDIESQADGFIKAIDDALKTAQKHTGDAPSTSSSREDKLSKWENIIHSGGKCLEFVNGETKEIKDNFLQSGETTEIIGNILERIGHVHWAVAALSMVGYLVSKCAKVSQNKNECLELLQDLITLLSHIKGLNRHITDKVKIEKDFQYIMEASISCASQLQSGKFFSFLKSTVNSGTLTAIRKKISELSMDLQLSAETELLRRVPASHPLLPQGYPSDAVGIEDQLKAVNELLNMENVEDRSSFALVIWGLGGIGKTTLAKAVVSTLNRSRYNYARIELDLISEKNNYKEMQRQILEDAFPSYLGGQKIKLRDDADGRDHLTQAFKNEANKPIFLFIDNALHMKDLEKILPENLESLPQHSRILITTRILRETEVSGLTLKDYPVKTLSDNHALTVLCNEPAIRDSIKNDVEEIVKLCNGIPLVLKIVGAHLRKQNYEADRCTQILGALKTGGTIKEKDLSECLFDFVYSKLEESTQEAFIEICCYYHQWGYLDGSFRKHVEYIVGAEELASLVDAALITIVDEEMSLFVDEETISIHDIILSIGCNMSKSSRITMDKNSCFEMDEAKRKGIRGLWIRDRNCVLNKAHLDLMKDKLRILVSDGGIDIQERDKVTLPEIRCIITDCADISGLNVEACHKLSFLRCMRLPTKETGQVKLPESLRSIELLFQPGGINDLSKIQPNSSLKKFYVDLQGERGRDFSNDEKVSSEKTFIKFLQPLNKLEHLAVLYCRSLCRVPEQLCMLQGLSTLTMNCFSELECLPECFGTLTSLKELDLTGCRRLKELPFTFGQLTSLTKLILDGCHSLEKLPPTFGQLKELEALSLDGCGKLIELPPTFGQFKELKYLSLTICGKLIELPLTFGQLKELKYLSLYGCGKLIELPPTFGQLTALRELDLRKCDSLREWPSILNNLNKLKSLKFVYVSCIDLEFDICSEFDICQVDDYIKIVRRNAQGQKGQKVTN